MASGSNLTNEQKREWAQLLFVQGLSQKEIAAKVGSAEKTIGTWKEKYNWEGLRKSLLVTKQEQLRRLYNQLDWLTQEIEARERKVADSKEADTINKLTAAIRSLETETSLAEIIDVGQKFLNFLRLEDLEEAKHVTGLYDAFIQTTLGGKTIQAVEPVNPRQRL